MRISLVFALIIMFACSAFAEEIKYRPSGPLNVRNQMPLYLFYMSMTPDKAETLKKGTTEIDTSYHVSNTILQQRPWPAQQFGLGETTREWWVYIDTEVNRLDLNVSYGISDSLEASVDIPYFIFSEGYLDGFIEDFEDAFSFIKTPNAREEKQRDSFQYDVRNKARRILLNTSEPNDFGEISAYLKYKVLEQTKWLPTTSIRGAVKFPTTKDEFLGSKKFDYGLGVLLDKNLFQRLFLYGNLNIIFVEKPDILERLDVFKYMAHGVLGAEYFVTDKLSMLFQATANTRLYDQGVPATTHDPVLLTFGFNYNFRNNASWQLAINENTSSATPDFGIFTSLRINM